ncbi:MAG: N-acetyltransferase [Oligoflexia bacterium]|nr:N-acetyltransferase [Oligoflexia bacterium]
MAKTAIIYPNVNIGRGSIIEDYCIIGSPFRGYNNEATVIGENSIIRSHTVIYAGNIIGNNFQTGNKVNIRECNEIGENVSIGTLTVVEHHIKILRDVRIHSQVFIPEYTLIEEGAWIGPNVVFTNAKYPLSPNVKNELRGPTVRRSAKIGANATILPGITIGINCLIGAGSVVVQDVEEESIVAGNPARVIRKIHY